jgi:hypothetical protein
MESGCPGYRMAKSFSSMLILDTQNLRSYFGAMTERVEMGTGAGGVALRAQRESLETVFEVCHEASSQLRATSTQKIAFL